MKRIMSLLLCLVLLAGLLGVFPVSAAGSLTVTTSANTVTVGQSVKVTLKYDGGGEKMGALQGYFTYDAAAFTYVGVDDLDGLQVSGGAGTVKFVWNATGVEGPTSVSFTLTLKTAAPGEGKFAVSTDEFVNDTDYSSLGTPGKTLSVSAINPTQSGNADLASLKPSKGTLTPKFSVNTTNYTVSVDYAVTSVTISATTADAGAKTAISGKNALSVGENTRVITVTAPNGTTKKYTVVITREAQQATDPDSSDTTTTTPTPAPDALEVTVDGTLMTVADTQPAVELPTGFVWSNVNLNGVDVPAAESAATGLTLLYLKNEVTQQSSFYIYRAESGEFALFRPQPMAGGTYVLLDMPAGQKAPAGTVPSTFPYEGGAVDAFAYESTGLADYLLVYAVSPTGVTGLYVYDRTDGTFQRYHQQPATVTDTPVVNDTPVNEEQPASFLAFFVNNQAALLTVAAVLAGLALLIAAVLITLRIFAGGSKGKH